MKLTTQEEYGLRCLLQIARNELRGGSSMPISEISQAEGLSVPNVGKLLRILRMGGFVESERGHAGGYRLARPADRIYVAEVVETLGGRFFGPEFCEEHSGQDAMCAHSTECSVRSLWNSVQFVVDRMLSRISIQDMLGGEDSLSQCLQERAETLLQVDELDPAT